MMTSAVSMDTVKGKIVLSRVMLLSLLAALLTVISANAQSSFSDRAAAKLVKRSVTGAELGSLICEDANGQLILCTGGIEESVAGIVTNVPYVTLNKPSVPEGSKKIFRAIVSADNGTVSKGDLLMANRGGTLARCNEGNVRDAYAVALEESGGSRGRIRVKLLSK